MNKEISDYYTEAFKSDPEGVKAFIERMGETIETVRLLVKDLPDEYKIKFVEKCRDSKGSCFCGVHVSVIDFLD